MYRSQIRHNSSLQKLAIKANAAVRGGQKAADPHRSDRAEAVRLLLRIEHHGAFRALVSQEASPWTVAMVSTITRWRRYLQFLLSEYCRLPARDLEPALRQILLLGIGELVILHTAPHAAVYENVSLVRSMVRSQATGLANGILRSVARSLEALPEPDTGDLMRDLAVRWSHPTWLVRRYIARFGLSDARHLLQYNNAAPPHYVRVARQSREEIIALLDEAGVAYTPSRYLKDYLRVEQLGPIIRAGWAQDGTCAVHDESAGLVVDLLDPQPGETVLDACAAPGGKAFGIAARMCGEGRLMAWDVHEGRLGRLRAAAEAQSIQVISAEVHNLIDAPEVDADRVLLDVPCTGTGVLAKRADLRWRRTPRDLAEILSVQDGLLNAAARRVRVGGTLVYSTCSIEPEENEERIAAFLKRDPGFKLVPAFGRLPEDLVTAAGHMATLPHVHGMDGAFAARLQRIR